LDNRKQTLLTIGNATSEEIKLIYDGGADEFIGNLTSDYKLFSIIITLMALIQKVVQLIVGVMLRK
jgi:hypothetical protein